MIKERNSKLLYPRLLLFVIIIVAVLLLIKEIGRPRAVVTPAISMAYAKAMERENESYVVTCANREDSVLGQWYYMDGNERKSMNLLGNVPGLELSYVFMEPKLNYFLVTGSIDEERTVADNIVTLNVKRWYPIAPIKRAYGPKHYREAQRFFYPRTYLDDYDVEKGDYKPNWDYYDDN